MESRMESWRGILENPSEEYRIFVAEDKQKQIIGFIDGGKNRGNADEYDAGLYAFYLLEFVKC